MLHFVNYQQAALDITPPLCLSKLSLSEIHLLRSRLASILFGKEDTQVVAPLVAFFVHNI